jgi:hypothetical protein
MRTGKGGICASGAASFKEIQVKYTFQDFCDPAVELSEDAPRIDLFEKEVADLKAQFSNLKVDQANLKSSLANIEGWFRTHISRLADVAAKEFVQKREIEIFLTALEKAELSKQVQQAVEEIFQREANELAKSTFNALCSKIQPYALKR